MKREERRSRGRINFMASSICFASFIFFSLLILGHAARPFYPLPSKVSDDKHPLQTFRPYNIAHRGSNGEIPEETAPAYERAIEEGADFIETDILSSKDGVLICFHDVTLDDTTDIAKHKEFANRKRTYEVQGLNITGFFTVDFTLKELQSLRARQRYPFRDQQHNGKFSIITFEEFIAIALDAPRIVGIYPEMKNPVFINQRVKWPKGKRYEDKFVETLEKYGYKGSYLSEEWLKQPAFIQSFAPTSLIYISNFTDLPKIFLIDDITIPTQDTNQSYWEITSDSYFDYIKTYVVGIGPWKDTVVPIVDNYLQTPTDLVARAHAHDLQVHPYTYRNENSFLHINFHQDPYEEFDYWINKIGVDGLFTDFTGSLHNFQKWTSPLPSNDTKNGSLLQKIAALLSSYKKFTGLFKNVRSCQTQTWYQSLKGWRSPAPFSPPLPLLSLPPFPFFHLQTRHLTIKLNSINYLIWKAQILHVVNANGIEKLLDGSLPPPIEFLDSTSSQKNPDFALWMWYYRLILSWIFSSTTEDLLPQIVSFAIASKAWVALAQLFASSSMVIVSDLRSQLHSLSKDGLSANNYISKITALCNTLTEIGQLVS